MEDIPIEVREYLSSLQDGVTKAQLMHQYPHLSELLKKQETRRAILDWLESEESWDQALTAFTMNCLEFLHSPENNAEAQIVRAFLLHSDPNVRVRAYEFLLRQYFPDENREAMFHLLHGMLLDSDDTVRSQGVRYIDRADVVDELRDFLERWYKLAPSRGWETTESYELLERLIS